MELIEIEYRKPQRPADDVFPDYESADKSLMEFMAEVVGYPVKHEFPRWKWNGQGFEKLRS